MRSSDHPRQLRSGRCAIRHRLSLRRRCGMWHWHVPTTYCRLWGAVYGVDSSPSMLLRAAEKNRGNGVRFLCENIENLRLPHKVDLITCNHDTLNYFTSLRALFRVLRSLHANLTPGGHLLFDMIVHTGRGRPGRFVQRIKVLRASPCGPGTLTRKEEEASWKCVRGFEHEQGDCVKSARSIGNDGIRSRHCGVCHGWPVTRYAVPTTFTVRTRPRLRARGSSSSHGSRRGRMA